MTSAGLLAWARTLAERELADPVGDPRRLVVQQRVREPSRVLGQYGRSADAIRVSAARELELGAWRVAVVLQEEGDGDAVRLVLEAWQRDTEESLRLVRRGRRAFGGTLRLEPGLRPEPEPPYPPA